jgi:preprotein translocase subunit YajC
MKRLIQWFLDLIEERKRKKRFKKKLEELRKRDPFIYNH